MMNASINQTITPLEQPPSNHTQPGIPIDPTNPLAWVLVISMLISSIDEPINAIAKLIQAIIELKSTRQNKQTEDDPSNSQQSPE